MENIPLQLESVWKSIDKQVIHACTQNVLKFEFNRFMYLERKKYRLNAFL